MALCNLNALLEPALLHVDIWDFVGFHFSESISYRWDRTQRLSPTWNIRTHANKYLRRESENRDGVVVSNQCISVQQRGRTTHQTSQNSLEITIDPRG